MQLSLLRPSTFAFLTAVTVATYACSSPSPIVLQDAGGEPDAMRSDSGAVADAMLEVDVLQGGDSAVDATADATADVSADGGADAALDAAADVAVDSGPPPGPLTANYVDYDINHVLVSGQSNAVATGSGPQITTAPQFGNLMFSTGVMPMAGCNGDGCTQYQTPSAATPLVPLVEGDSFFTGSPVETSGAGFAAEAAFLAQNDYRFGVRAGYPTKHDVLITNHGRSGNTIWCLRKGGCNYQIQRGRNVPFAQGITEMQDAKRFATAAGKSLGVRAVVFVHGESDHYSYVANSPEVPLNGTDGTPNKIQNYADALVELQQDYETTARGITGQAAAVPLLISGVSGWTSTRESRLANLQLDAHVRAPGKVVLVTPGYPFLFRNDCLHYTNHSERRLGEYFAKVYTRIVFGGETWEPVRPKQVSRVGRVITLRYFVPRPPLVFDNVQVAPIQNQGFDVTDNGVMVGVESVVLTAADSVTITLTTAPVGTVRVKYAQNQDVNPNTRCTGPTSGARGNLRDSDATLSHFNNDNGQPYRLENWGVIFDLPVP
jgi:hypothetical protein